MLRLHHNFLLKLIPPLTLGSFSVLIRWLGEPLTTYRVCACGRSLLYSLPRPLRALIENPSLRLLSSSGLPSGWTVDKRRDIRKRAVEKRNYWTADSLTSQYLFTWRNAHFSQSKIPYVTEAQSVLRSLNPVAQSQHFSFPGKRQTTRKILFGNVRWLVNLLRHVTPSSGVLLLMQGRWLDSSPGFYRIPTHRFCVIKFMILLSIRHATPSSVLLLMMAQRYELASCPSHL